MEIISVITFNKEFQNLLVGDLGGEVIIYKIDMISCCYKKIKKIRKLNIGMICSLEKFNRFIFFGGDQQKIRILDLSTGKLFPGFRETAINQICSLQVCQMKNKKTFLAVSGENSNYSQGQSDLFDLSNLLPMLKIPNQDFSEQNKTNLSTELNKAKVFFAKGSKKIDSLNQLNKTLKNENEKLKLEIKELNSKNEILKKEAALKINIIEKEKNNLINRNKNLKLQLLNMETESKIFKEYLKKSLHQNKLLNKKNAADLHKVIILRSNQKTCNLQNKKEKNELILEKNCLLDQNEKLKKKYSTKKRKIKILEKERREYINFVNLEAKQLKDLKINYVSKIKSDLSKENAKILRKIFGKNFKQIRKSHQEIFNKEK